MVDTKYGGYQSTRQRRFPRDHAAFVEWWGGGSTGGGGRLEIQSDIHDTDFCYVIECCIFDVWYSLAEC